MRSSRALFSRLGELQGDTELALFKLIKNHKLENVAFDDVKLRDGNYRITLSLGSINGVRSVMVSFEDEAEEYPLRELSVDDGLSILEFLEEFLNID